MPYVSARWAFRVARNADPSAATNGGDLLTKRILGLALGAAAAASLALPAAPAQAANCIGWATTPVECAQQVVARIRALCPIEGTQPTCLPFSS